VQAGRGMGLGSSATPGMSGTRSVGTGKMLKPVPGRGFSISRQETGALGQSWTQPGDVPQQKTSTGSRKTSVQMGQVVLMPRGSPGGPAARTASEELRRAECVQALLCTPVICHKRPVSGPMAWPVPPWGGAGVLAWPCVTMPSPGFVSQH